MKARIPNQGKAPNQAEMMKQIQKMQEDMQRTTEELEATEFSASAGGGAVEAVVSGAKEVLRIKIKPEVADPSDVEMLEDLLTAALNEALRKASETTEREMNKLGGGLNIPGLGGPGGLGGLGGLF